MASLEQHRLENLLPSDVEALRAYRGFVVSQGDALAAPGHEDDDLLHAAILDGCWGPYLDSLQRRGVAYAMAGTEYPTWIDRERAFRDRVRERHLAAGGATPVLGGLQLIQDLRIELIGKAYFSVQREWQLQSEAQNRMLFDASTLPMFTYLRDTQVIVEVNRAMCERAGYRREELVEQSVTLLCSPSTPGPQAGRSSAASRMRHKNGSTIPVEIAGTDIKVHDREYRLVSVIDVTDHENTREALHKTAVQLQHAQKMDALGRLAGGVAHDFNNILTVVASYACMLEENLDPTDERRADATEIRMAGERGAQITRRLLALSRDSIVAPQALQLDQVVAGFRLTLRHLVGEHITLEIVPGKVPPILGDAAQIEQVLMNLAVNARDAMGSSGRLTLETSTAELSAEEAAPLGLKADRYVVLAVSDTGTGMSPEIQSKIFDPFFTTKATGHGTGLGLPIVHSIVTQSHGAVSVFSQPGHGTTFRVHLPVSGEAVPVGPVAVPAPPTKMPPVTVLVVEAQPELRAASARVLQDAGCTVLEAATCSEARRVCVLHDGPIDVAVIDVVLADGRGDLVATELRELRPGLQILLTSGFPASKLRPSGEAPAGLLAKPFRPAQLREAVARVATVAGSIRRSEPSLQPRVLIVDDDPDLRKMLCRLLRRASFDVVEVDSGRKALAELESGRFDVVLSDVHMPDGNGLDLVRGVRRIDLDLPVILVTGKPDVASAATALEFGAFRYLTKPLDIETVEKVVRQAARAHALARIRREAMTIAGNTVGASDRAGLEVRFEQSLTSLWMAYQPIIDARTGSLFGVEALMRSREPSIPNPMAMLDAATTLGRLPLLGRRVRHLAGTALGARADIANVFVNLHPNDLMDIELVNPDSALTRIAPRVVLEVTERESLVSSPLLAARLARLRELGFRIAVDDIGAGYSGLTSFADLTPEIVKIDMSLVRAVHTNNLKQRTIGALCSLCHEFGALVVGEGVETSDERDCLVDLGCDLLQGYLLAKPAAELPAL